MPGTTGSLGQPEHQYFSVSQKPSSIEDNVLLRFEAPKVPLKWYHRALFFLILALISFFLSEMISGRRTLSMGFNSVYLMFPVYLFHLIVISWLVLKVTDGKPTFPLLFVAGSVFGMFESYITKELWHPNWNTEFTYMFAGVSVPHSLILVCFWHNFNSFIIPLYIGELCFTNSTVNPISDALPKRVKFILEKRRTTTTILLALLSMWGGNFLSEFSSLEDIAYAAIIILIILGLTAFWRWVILRNMNISIMDLIPQDAGFVFAFAGLLLFYMLNSFAYHLMRIPGWYPGQTTVGFMYLFFFLVLCGSVVKSRLRQGEYEEIGDPLLTNKVFNMPEMLIGNYTATTAAPTHYWRTVILITLLFLASALGCHFLQPYTTVPIIIAYIVGVSAGLCLLLGAVIEAVQGLILLKKKKML